MEMQEYLDGITEVLKEFEKKLNEIVQELLKTFEKVEKHSRTPKWYVKANRPTVIACKNRVYHCRNNC